MPVLRPHSELECARHELFPGQFTILVAMLCHVVKQDSLVSFLVIAAYVEDIPSGFEHDSDAVEFRMAGMKNVTAHITPSW